VPVWYVLAQSARNIVHSIQWIKARHIQEPGG
jgi:hypothetical protein